jgi:murein DD-endopeptidase MepM/ murein hydrolase activator NlpD
MMERTRFERELQDLGIEIEYPHNYEQDLLSLSSAKLSREPASVPSSDPVPFAPLPSSGSYWPIITAHSMGRTVSFKTTKGSIEGKESRMFLYRREGGKRYHAAVDLFANFGDPIVACEKGTIINCYRFLYNKKDKSNIPSECGKDPSPYRATYAIIVEHPNVVVNYGEVAWDSLIRAGLKKGSAVSAGQVIGFAGNNPGGSSMLHFETYTKGTKSNKSWPKGSSRPKELLNPTKYLLYLKNSGLGAAAPQTGQSLPKGPAAPLQTTIDKASGGTPSFGRLIVDTSRIGIPEALRFSYDFSSLDLIWTAKFIVGEAGGRDDLDNHAVIWAMFNRYAFFTHKNYPSFHQFLRAYSTPLQPVLNSWGAAKRHMNKPEFVRTGGYYSPPHNDIPKGQLKRHLKRQSMPWNKLPEKARSLAERALKGQVSNPIGNASEFGSTYEYFHDHYDRYPNDSEWRRYTESYAQLKGWSWIGSVQGLDQKNNTFFVQKRRTVAKDPKSPYFSELPYNAVQVIPQK